MIAEQATIMLKYEVNNRGDQRIQMIIFLFYFIFFESVFIVPTAAAVHYTLHDGRRHDEEGWAE